jgi:hypothetical protein
VHHQMDAMDGRDNCWERVAALALRMYRSVASTNETRLTVALLVVQWFASEHHWIRNDRFPPYPFTLAWFRLFNTTEKLALHLRDSYRQDVVGAQCAAV